MLLVPPAPAPATHAAASLKNSVRDDSVINDSNYSGSVLNDSDSNDSDRSKCALLLPPEALNAQAPLLGGSEAAKQAQVLISLSLTGRFCDSFRRNMPLICSLRAQRSAA